MQKVWLKGIAGIEVRKIKPSANSANSTQPDTFCKNEEKLLKGQKMPREKESWPTASLNYIVTEYEEALRKNKEGG